MVRNRVNGVLLAQNVGKQISIIGTVLKTNPSNNSFDIQSTDNHVVNISCEEPIDSLVDGFIEVHGTVQGKNSVICDYYICFPPEMTKEFDVEKDNEAVMIANTIPNPWRI